MVISINFSVTCASRRRKTLPAVCGLVLAAVDAAEATMRTYVLSSPRGTSRFGTPHHLLCSPFLPRTRFNFSSVLPFSGPFDGASRRGVSIYWNGLTSFLFDT